MTDQQPVVAETTPAETPPAGTAVGVACRLAAGLAALAGVTGGLAVLFGVVSEQGQLSAVALGAVVALAGGGLCMGVALWALADVLGTRQNLPSALGSAPGQPASNGPVEVARLDELLELLRETRDAALLDEPARAAGQAARRERLRDRGRSRTQAALLAQRWELAQAELAQLRASGAWDDSLAGLAEQAQAQADAAEQVELPAVTREVRALISLGQPDAACAVAQRMCDRFPNNAVSAQLLGEALRAQGQAIAQRCAALYRQVESAVQARRWADALRAAEELTAGHASSAEAAAVRPKLLTLRTNMEIAQRQAAEQQFVQLMREQRHAQALAVAQQVIAQYPESPQAKALAGHLPRLAQLLGQPPATPS